MSALRWGERVMRARAERTTLEAHPLDVHPSTLRLLAEDVLTLLGRIERMRKSRMTELRLDPPSEPWNVDLRVISRETGDVLRDWWSPVPGEVVLVPVGAAVDARQKRTRTVVYDGVFELAWLRDDERVRSAGDGTCAAVIVSPRGERRIDKGDSFEVMP